MDSNILEFKPKSHENMEEEFEGTPATQEERETIMGEVLRMAESLMWYARREGTHSYQGIVAAYPELGEEQHQTVWKKVQAVQEEWPEEVAALSSESGAWSHGFNSGIVAALRLVDGLDEDVEFAIDSFPDLDT